MDYESGEFGRGGERVCAVELTYRGVLGEPFISFAINRAHRLSLNGWISADPEGVKIAAQGPQAMIDAFEIVCSLGPIEADVAEWDRADIQPGLNSVGFDRR